MRIGMMSWWGDLGFLGQVTQLVNQFIWNNKFEEMVIDYPDVALHHDFYQKTISIKIKWLIIKGKSYNKKIVQLSWWLKYHL